MEKSAHEQEKPQTRRRPRENLGARRVGRGAFLGIVGAGIATMFYGNRISSVTNALTKPIANVTGNFFPQGWRIYTVAATMPVFDPVTWRLRIDGLVHTPVEITYDQLRALPRAEQVSTFHCVTGWEVTNVHWAGVRFTDLLALAGPLPGAHAAHFVSAEIPYDDYLTLDQAELPDVMLAYEMNGAPLLQEHGAPVRVIIPEMYGYKNVKWVRQISLVRRLGSGYWENNGYDVNAWVGHSNGYG